MNRSLYVRALLLVAFLFAGMGLCACTASGDAEEISPVAPNSAAGGKDGKSSAGGKSSGKEVPGSWVEIDDDSMNEGMLGKYKCTNADKHE